MKNERKSQIQREGEREKRFKFSKWMLENASKVKKKKHMQSWQLHVPICLTLVSDSMKAAPTTKTRTIGKIYRENASKRLISLFLCVYNKHI